MYYTLACLGCTVLCACVWTWAYGQRARKFLCGLPGFPTVPVLGNVLQLIGGSERAYRLIVDISNKNEEHQKPVVFWFGPLPALVVSDPEDVKLVTNSYIEKPFYYNFGRIWVGEGLVTASGTVWKRNIKKLAGTFIGPIVDGYQGVFNAQAQKLLDNLKGEVGGAPFDIMQKYLAFATLESICQTALGFPSISNNLVTTEYYDAFTKTLELLVQRGMNPIMHPDWVYRMTPAYRELVKCVETLHNVSKTVIAKRRREFNEMKQNGSHEEYKPGKKVFCVRLYDCRTRVEKTYDCNGQFPDNGRTKFRSFLDILLEFAEADPSMTEDQIRAEVDTIIVGGQETTATTLMYTILMIGSYPHLQEKMYAELQSIFGDSSRPVEKEDLARMTYCEAVIYESLRLYPPVPAVMRDASHDLKISAFQGSRRCVDMALNSLPSSVFQENYNLGPFKARVNRLLLNPVSYILDPAVTYHQVILKLITESCTIPKGTACVVNAYGAGRSRRTWGADALEFKPERWLDGRPVPAAAFLPFSYGKRACIGKRYAMALLKTLLVYCLRELIFVSDVDKLRYKVDIALKPISGHFVQVVQRK